MSRLYPTHRVHLFLFAYLISIPLLGLYISIAHIRVHRKINIYLTRKHPIFAHFSLFYHCMKKKPKQFFQIYSIKFDKKKIEREQCLQMAFKYLQHRPKNSNKSRFMTLADKTLNLFLLFFR